MKYLIDTDISSYYLRGRYNLIQLFERKGFENIRLSRATVAELEVLAFRNPQSKINLSSIQSLAQLLGVLEINRESWQTYSKIKAKTLTGGATRGDIDILNVSVALQHGLVVVTNNTSHYEDLVQVENWKTEK